MASPSMTNNSVGDLLTSATIAASGTRTADQAADTKFELGVQISVVFGTVAATSGVQVDFFVRGASGTVNDTITSASYLIPSTASTTKVETFKSPTGKWHLLITNLDATNSVTATTATTITVDAVA